MKIKVVGIIGSEGMGIANAHQSGSGVGKDTLADIMSNLGYHHIKFADSLRDLFYADYDLPVEKKRNKSFEFDPNPDQYTVNHNSPRYVHLLDRNLLDLDPTQTLNKSIIEYAGVLRSIDPDVFVKATLEKILGMVQNTKEDILKIVISDVRQFNEFLLLRALKGTLVEIWTTKPLRERQHLDCQLLEFSDIKLSNNRSIESLTETIVQGNFRNREESFSYLEVDSSYLEYLLKGYKNESPFRSQN